MPRGAVVTRNDAPAVTVVACDSEPFGRAARVFYELRAAIFDVVLPTPKVRAIAAWVPISICAPLVCGDGRGLHCAGAAVGRRR